MQIRKKQPETKSKSCCCQLKMKVIYIYMKPMFSAYLYLFTTICWSQNRYPEFWHLQASHTLHLYFLADIIYLTIWASSFHMLTLSNLNKVNTYFRLITGYRAFYSTVSPVTVTKSSPLSPRHRHSHLRLPTSPTSTPFCPLAPFCESGGVCISVTFRTRNYGARWWWIWLEYNHRH